MKILLVEDNPGDARLTKELLKEVRIEQFEITHANRLSEAIHLLSLSQVDAILLDLGLPDSNGVDTFSKLHDSASQTPIVVLSGATDEAVALKTVQLGAQDYLIKGEVNSNMLHRVIRYAIERKHVEEDLLVVRKAVDTAGNAIAISDSQGHHIYQNKSFTDLFEYTAEDIEAAGGGTAVFAVESVAHTVFESIMKGMSWSGEVEMRSKSGRISSFFLVADAVKDDTGKIVGLVEVFTDINERKHLEYQLRKKHDELQLILDSIPAYVFYKDKDGKMLNINKAATALAYVPKEKLLQKTVFDLMPETADKYNRDDMEVIRSGQPKMNIEESLELPSGVRWLKTDKLPIKDDDGNIAGLLGFSVDITDLKTAQEKLRTSEEKLRVMFETMTDAVVLTDLSGTILDINASALRMFGYKRDEVMGLNGLDVVAFDNKERAVKNLAESMYGSEITGIQEYKILDKNGRVVNVEIIVNRLSDSTGKPYGFIVVMRDVTARKAAEEALRESEQKLRWMFESIKDGIFIVGLDGKVMEANAGVEKITGYSREQLLGHSGLDYMFPGFKGDAIGILQKMIARGGTQNEVVVPMKTAAGELIEVEATSSALRDSSGNPIGLIGTMRDISERKRMENALKDSEEKLRLMFSSMADGVVVTDTEGKIIDINEAQMRMFGFKEKNELVGKGGFDFLAVRERGRALADMFEVYEKGVNTGSTYTVVDRNGREFECELSTAMLHDAAGKPSGTITVMRDVTERRRIEEAIRESEERYRLLAENVSDVIWTMDMNLKYTYISPSVINLRGFTAEEAVKMSVEETLTPESFRKAMQVLREELEVDHSDQYMSRTLEIELTCKNGSTVWTEMKISFLLNSDGTRVGFMGITRDITERRKVEGALRDANEKLQVIFDSIGEAVTVVDLDANIVDANKEALRLHGFNSKDEIIGRKSSALVAVTDRERAVAGAVKSLKPSYLSGRSEYKLVDTSGREFDGEFNIAVIRDNIGKPSGFIGVARDISERKKVEELQNRLAAIVEFSQDAIIGKTLDGIITSWNHGAEMLYGYTAEEVIGRPISVLAPADHVAEVDWVLKKIRTGEAIRNYETVRVTKDGRRIIVLLTLSPIKDALGKVVAASTMAQNITDRKKMEEALRNSEEKLRVMFDSMMDGIVVSDMNIKILDVNKAGLEMMGAGTKEDLIGRSAMDVIRFKDQEAAMANLARMFKEQRPQEKVEYSLILPGGRELEAEVSTAMMLDSAGNVMGFVNAIRDITERKKWEEALRESEARYRLLAENATDVIWIVNMEMRLTYVSPSITRLLGYTVEEALERTMDQSYTPSSFATAMQIAAEEIAIEQTGQGDPKRSRIQELGLYRKNGSVVPVEANFSFLRDNEGKAFGMLAMVRDITERKQSEEELKKSEEKYRNLVEREKDVIVSVDALGFVRSVNSAVTSWGYTTDEASKMNFLDLIAPEWREVTATQLQARLLETGEFVGETMVIRKDGEKRPIEYSAVVIQEEGKYAGAQAIVRDISERKKAEEAVQARERYFRAITDLSSGAVLVLSLEGNILDVTGGLERISGHTRESTIGRSAIEFIHPDELEKAGAALNESMRNPGKTVAFDARLRNARGEWQWTESMITNLLDHPDVHGIVNHLVDITELKKAEEKDRNHAKRIEALYSVAQVISQAPTLEAMLRDSLNKVCEAMDTEAGCILMLDLDENTLELKSSRGVKESIRQQFSTIELTDQGIENIMKLQGPVTEVDETHTVADIAKAQRATAEIGRKAIAATPLFRGDDLQGFLVVFSTRERRFSGEDLELFKATASEISIGINNLMLLEKTREMSVTDELTDLYNRRYFFEMLDVEINRAGRTNHPFSLVMIDLDGFKEYNDKYGHSNGDAVLGNFSRMLKSSIRKSDLAFRYGGDEFVLILPSADAEKAKKIIQRARAKWQKAPLTRTRISGEHVGFSSGIAEYPENAESPDGLIFLADAALYQAKKKGYEDKVVSELRTLSTDIMDVATQDQVYALAATVDARDPYTYGHSQRVADIAMQIGKQIGMSGEDLAKLHAAALLHDIGKVGVPDSILTKVGKPSPEEWVVIKKHCAEGARILGYVKELSTLVPIVLHHHEWYDGSGYPSGIKGIEIPSGARITCVADSYDTMVTKRPYRDAVTPREACEELKRNAGTQFDPVIVDVWCKLVEEEGE